MKRKSPARSPDPAVILLVGEGRPDLPPPLWVAAGGTSTANDSASARPQTGRAARQLRPCRPWRGRRWLFSGLVGLLILLVAGRFAAGTPRLLPAPPAVQASASAQHTSASTAPTTGQVSGQSSPTRTATPSATPAPAPAVAQAFLASYFSWQPGETDNAYVGSWQPWVEGSARAVLIKNAPRLLIDQGADSAASCPTPQVPPGALEQHPQEAQLTLAWSLLVLPSGGELAQWQARHVQATLALIHIAGQGWQVAGLSWSSTTEGGG